MLVALTRMLSANIQGVYWRGRYAKHDGIIRSDDGFMNGTLLCLSHNKCIYVWLDANDELIKQCDKQITQDFLTYGISDNGSIDHIIDLGYDIDGVYISPYLMPSLCSWLDPAFIFNSARIINRYLAHEYMDLFEQQKKDSAKQLIAPKPIVNSKCVVVMNCNDTPSQYCIKHCLTRSLKGCIHRTKRKHPQSNVEYIAKNISRDYSTMDNLTPTKHPKYYTSKNIDLAIEEIRASLGSHSTVMVNDGPHTYLCDTVL